MNIWMFQCTQSIDGLIEGLIDIYLVGSMDHWIDQYKFIEPYIQECLEGSIDGLVDGLIDIHKEI